MEKENLDDLMRQKFDTDDPGARFDFQEEYWEQARALLEADERKRKRRFLWWWWLGAGCLCVGAALWFWPDGSSQQEGVVPSGQVLEKTDSAGSEKTQTDKELGLKNNHNDTHTAQSGKAEKTDSGAPDGAATTSHETTVTGQGNATAKGRNQGKNGAAAGKTAPQPSAGFGEKRSGSQTPKSGTAPSASAPTQALVNPSDPRTGRSDRVPGNTPVGTEQVSAAKTESTQTSGDGTAESASVDASIEQAAEQKSVAEQRQVQSVPPIQPIDFQWPVLLPYVQFLPQKDPIEQCPVFTEPFREPRLSIGLGASGLAFFPKNQAAQWGGAAGVFADYRLSRSLSLTVGAAWRYIPLDGIVADSAYEPQVTEQLRYSFGFERVRTSLRPAGLHALEVPVALRWHSGVWYLEGGAALSRLLGVRADWVERRSASLQLEPPVRETSRMVWSDTQLYRRTWISPMLGAGWQRGRWSATLRTVWLPADIAPPGIPDEPRAKGWKAGAELGLRWRIF